MDIITIDATKPMNRQERRLLAKIRAKGTVISETPTENTMDTVTVNDHRNGADSVTSTPVADSAAPSVQLTPEQLAEARRVLEARQPVGRAALHALGAGAKFVAKSPGLLLKGVGFVGGITVRGAKAVGGAVADGYKKAGA